MMISNRIIKYYMFMLKVEIIFGCIFQVLQIFGLIQVRCKVMFFNEMVFIVYIFDLCLDLYQCMVMLGLCFLVKWFFGFLIIFVFDNEKLSFL